ncbi:MAG: zinc ribbon domain-containing protein [Desulfobacteraceae bacterium]|nr:zinc ribbon domain-containing protein [Desulfobacteraceae bacterium]
MPIFEYKCNKCDKTFETLVLGSDVPQCPSCSSEDLSRLISKCGFVTASSGASDDGQSVSVSSSSSPCSGCSATSCSTCSSN